MKARKVVALAVALVLVLLAARFLFWNDQRDVRRRIAAIAAAVPTDGGGAGLAAFMTDDVILKTDTATFIGGKPAVQKFVRDGTALLGPMNPKVDDMQVEIVDRSTATVFFTLTISGARAGSGPAPRQVHVMMKKLDGAWLVSRAEVLRTLEGQ